MPRVGRTLPGDPGSKYNHIMRRLSILLSLTLCVELSARQPVHARHAMVGAQEELATDAGVRVLKAGGNAVDAAIAVGFALAVTHSSAGNIGGGGFMLIRMADGRTTFIDFRERAPEHASHDMYLDAKGNLTRDSVEGWRASGVPGTVRGFGLAHEKYGHMKWSEIMGPAIELASKGYTLTYDEAQSMQRSRNLAKFADSHRIFQRDGKFYEPGDTFAQPELARTLERIAKNGPDEFYTGETAKKLAEAEAKNGGLITLDDLKNMTAVERKPLTSKYKGYDIITSPPPSSGGVGILQMMAMLEGSGYEKSGVDSAAEIHYVAETMRRFYADRNEYMGDPDFIKNPISGLLDPAYIMKRRATIEPDRATPSDQVNPGKPKGSESTETTHFNVVDAEGNAVAVTYTLNGGYGSGVTAPGLGFLLNNEMDDFASKPGTPNMFGLVQGEANAIAPDKRPLSSMVPTILAKDGKLFMVVGAPGGSHIITGVMQVILNVVDFGMNPQDAIDTPRFHHQWKPDRLELERGISPDTAALLKQMGYQIQQDGRVSVARVEAIVSDGGWLLGGVDGRAAGGKAAGY
ncbi:MAG TPA: gamma-glutamyltransferase [Bryobacteraceae bacterium]|nr:gamma-glutamyltransferase [Bryobacteraceae bacterium]